MHIVPMRDLKDTTKIEKLCYEDNEPVFVTKNGYGRLVVMSNECFKKYQDMYLYDCIQKGIEDVKAGKVTDADKVMQEIKQKYGL